MRFWRQGVPSVKTRRSTRHLDDAAQYRVETEDRVRAAKKRNEEEAARLRLAQKGIKLGRH